MISVTRNWKIANIFVKKSPKIPKYLHQTSIWKSKTSTSKYFWNLKLPTTNHVLKMFNYVQKDCFLQLGQVYFWSASTKLQDITTNYKLIYRIYKHKLFNKVIKKYQDLLLGFSLLFRSLCFSEISSHWYIHKMWHDKLR